MPIPIEKNEHMELHIDAYNTEGAGVARHQNMAVFVPGALIGETVLAQAIKISKQYAVARLVSIIVSSPLRVAPPCPVYDQCGGCVLEHMQPSEQSRFKQQRIYDCFMHIGHIDLGAIPTLHSMENAYRYRNKASFPVAMSENEPHIGLYAQRSHRIIDVDDCLLQHIEHAKIIRSVRSWISEQRIVPYDEHARRGSLRHIVTRRSNEGSWLVCLVANEFMPDTDKLIERLTGELPNITGIVLNLNHRSDNVILSQEEHILFGQSRLAEQFMGLRFSVSIRSFMQVNPGQTEVLYQRALDFAALDGNETVVDAYCGIGAMTLLFAGHARFVHGIECVSVAVEDAVQNASLNNIANVKFHCDYAEKALPLLVRDGQSIDVLLLDPPRKGCDKAVLQCAIDAKIPRVVYVSCDPATLARDAAILTDGGYRLKRIEGVDMFGQTSHVETVVLMSRVNK